VSITGGALGAPVREFTIATTLQRLLLDIVDIGADLKWVADARRGDVSRHR
jgi:PmbA protein